MLWYKAWLDTRWRFLIGLVLLTCSAVGIVFTYPRVLRLMPLVPTLDLGGELGRRVREAAELAREYRGFVWSQWFRQTPTQIGTLFAVFLGSGGLVTGGSGSGGLFTLSLPASRNRVLGVRAAAGLWELAALALVPSLLIPLVSPAVGASYSVVDALTHALCLFVGGSVFFSLAILLSTVFGDLWRPLLMALLVAVLVGVCEMVLRDASRFGIFTLMSGEVYFRSHAVPWVGLVTSATLSVALLYGASVSFARRDF